MHLLSQKKNFVLMIFDRRKLFLAEEKASEMEDDLKVSALPVTFCIL